MLNTLFNQPPHTRYETTYEAQSKFVVLQKEIGEISKFPIVLHGLVPSDMLDDHSETTYTSANFEGTTSHK